MQPCSLPAPARAVALLVTALAVTSPDAAAQDAPARASSVAVGGFLIGESRLVLAKVERARGRWALVADVTRDGVRERWPADATHGASRGDYVMWSASAAVRRYTRPGARGFFAEASGGAARATLEVTGDGAARTRTATVPLAAWGAGGRLGIARSPAFVELGYRSAIPLATRHLHTDDVAPDGSTRESVTTRSWYFGRGKPASQLYVGVGLTL
jgi:hypothetical protein